MAFQFSLESFYRLRKSLEQQQMLKLAAASNAVAQARGGMARLDALFIETQRVWRAEVENSNMTPVLRLGAISEGNYLQVRARAVAEVKQAEANQNLEMSQYREALQNREILESLRARGERMYRREKQRREQQRIDEMHLLRSLLLNDDANLPSE